MTNPPPPPKVTQTAPMSNEQRMVIYMGQIRTILLVLVALTLLTTCSTCSIDNAVNSTWEITPKPVFRNNR